MRGGIDPKQMQRMLKQFGIKSEELDAKRVVFELPGGKNLVVNNPSVTVVDMQGKKTFTVMGETSEASQELPKADIEMVAKQANVDLKKAEAALKKNEGDIASAILELKGEQ